MVQVVENRADIAGRIQAMRADPERPDYRIVTIEVHSATPVEGYANMFAGAAGTRLEILVAADQAGPLAPRQKHQVPHSTRRSRDRFRQFLHHGLTRASGKLAKSPPHRV